MIRSTCRSVVLLRRRRIRIAIAPVAARLSQVDQIPGLGDGSARIAPLAEPHDARLQDPSCSRGAWQHLFVLGQCRTALSSKPAGSRRGGAQGEGDGDRLPMCEQERVKSTLLVATDSPRPDPRGLHWISQISEPVMSRRRVRRSPRAGWTIPVRSVGLAWRSDSSFSILPEGSMHPDYSKGGQDLSATFDTFKRVSHPLEARKGSLVYLVSYYDLAQRTAGRTPPWPRSKADQAARLHQAEEKLFPDRRRRSSLDRERVSRNVGPLDQARNQPQLQFDDSLVCNGQHYGAVGVSFVSRQR